MSGSPRPGLWNSYFVHLDHWTKIVFLMSFLLPYNEYSNPMFFWPRQSEWERTSKNKRLRPPSYDGTNTADASRGVPFLDFLRRPVVGNVWLRASGCWVFLGLGRWLRTHKPSFTQLSWFTVELTPEHSLSQFNVDLRTRCLWYSIICNKIQRLKPPI